MYKCAIICRKYSQNERNVQKYAQSKYSMGIEKGYRNFYYVVNTKINNSRPKQGKLRRIITNNENNREKHNNITNLKNVLKND